MIYNESFFMILIVLRWKESVKYAVYFSMKFILLKVEDYGFQPNEVFFKNWR